MKSINTVSTLVSLLLAATVSLSLPAQAESAAAGKYKIDPVHSSVVFSMAHLGLSQFGNGRFNTFEGDFNLNPNAKSDVSVTIQTASVDTNHQKRDEHLRSPDFLNSKQFPIMRFVSRKVSYAASGEPVSIEGDLELHGVTKPATFLVKAVGAGKDPWSGYRSGYTATSVIKRSDFGMKFGLPDIGDDISVTMQIEAIKQ